MHHAGRVPGVSVMIGSRRPLGEIRLGESQPGVMFFGSSELRKAQLVIATFPIPQENSHV